MNMHDIISELDEEQRNDLIELLKRAMSISSMGIHVVNIHTMEMYYSNEAGFRLLGQSPCDYKGRKCYEVFFGTDKPCKNCRLKETMAGESRHEIYVPETAQTFLTNTQITKWQGKDVYVEYVTEITELKRIEQNQQQLLNQMDKVIHNVPGAVCLYKWDGIKLQPLIISDKYSAMLGTDAKKSLEKTHGLMFRHAHPDDIKGLQDAIMLALSQTHTLNYTYRSYNEQMKKYIWLNVQGKAIVEKSGEIYAYVTYTDVSKDKAIEEKLRQSANIINIAMENANINVWSYDCLNKRLVHYNNGMIDNEQKIIEAVPESMIADGTIHSESVAVFREMFQQFMETRKTVQGDLQVRANNKRGYDWKRIVVTPVIENNSIVRAVGISVNITIRKEKEKQYLQMVDHMAALEDELLIAKGRNNLSRNKVNYYKRKSNEGIRLLDNQNTFDEAVAMVAETAILKSDTEKIYQVLNREKLINDYIAGNRDGSLEYKRSQGSGDGPFWVLLKYTMFEEPESGDIIFFVYSYDISSRVLENKMIAKLGHTEYDIMGLIDAATHRYIRKNVNDPSALSEPMSGDFDEELLQRIPQKLILSEQQTTIEQTMIEHVLKELETKDIHFVTYSIYDEQGRHHRKKMQFSYLDDTKTIVFYYRSDISKIYDREQEQLYKTEQALETARRASAAKTEFFSRMSHDMRTPMNGILGLAQLSVDETDIDVVKANIAKIRESGNYLLGLINDTLDFQKIESGKIILEKKSIEVKEVFSNTCELIKRLAEEKGVSFRIANKNADMNTIIMVDMMRMKQIFLNLLNNAVKFTPSGGMVEFGIEVVRRQDMTAQCIFKVNDTGIGMSREFLNNGIFKPFSQEFNNKTASYAGTGLGLSIAKRLIELMGGTIEVQSEPGEGTQFTIRMNIEIVDASEAAKSNNNVKIQLQIVRKGLKNRRILLAEDHPLNAEIAQRVLKKAECKVEWAKNGQECVEKFEKSQPGTYDLILMDIRMPILNGLEAAKQIRNSEHDDALKVPILAMTANAYDDDVKKSIAAGMNDHLSKPINQEELYMAIMKLLAK